MAILGYRHQIVCASSAHLGDVDNPTHHSGIAVTLDGFLYDEVVRGDQGETTARFRLIVSPTDEVVDEMVLPCTATTPALAGAVLHDLAPGDQLRITGYLPAPHTG
ncbi:hypothetical protein [Streptomyces sp. NPDC048252]